MTETIFVNNDVIGGQVSKSLEKVYDFALPIRRRYAVVIHVEKYAARMRGETTQMFPFVIIAAPWFSKTYADPKWARVDGKNFTPEETTTYFSNSVTHEFGRTVKPPFYRSTARKWISEGSSAIWPMSAISGGLWGDDDECTPWEMFERVMALYDHVVAAGGYFAFSNPALRPPVYYMPHPVTGNPDGIREYVRVAVIGKSLAAVCRLPNHGSGEPAEGYSV